MAMRAERIKVEPMSFASIMTSISQGTYRIPRFQRMFVWERTRIQKLLDSMYREYPIGTVFMWKAPSAYNHMLRSVDYLNQPSIDNNQSYTFILDGQQRLTSLYVTINGLKVKGENYSKIVVDIGNEDESKPLFQYRNPDGRRWISVRDIVSETESFRVYDELALEYRHRFQEIRQRLVSYPFSVVSVSSMELNDAIEIFERINQQSKRLTRYDLIAASVLTDEFDLRERSQEDIIKPLEKTFGSIPETNVPQALALNIRGRTEHETQMNLESGDVQRVWNRTVECLMLAVNFVQTNLRVRRVDFIPYSAILPVLAYYFYYGKIDSVRSNLHREQLEKLFWRTAFAERYTAASQTRMTEDAERIRKLLDLDEQFDLDTMPVSLDEKTLIQATMLSKTSAMRNGILCMLTMKRPLHFINGGEIAIQGDHFATFTRAERHHIFPQAFLQSAGVSKRRVQSIPNFCFTTLDVNQEMSNLNPSEYFNVLRDKHGDSGDFEKIMRSHLIPIGEDSGIWNDDFNQFLNQRSQLMVNEIKRLCGMAFVMSEEQRDPIANKIEIAIRAEIHNTLSATYGHNYWKQAIPGDVQKRVHERIESILNNQPGTKRSDYDDPQQKLSYCDVGDYHKIIFYGQNWQHFSGIFRSKNELERMFDDFRRFRNAVKHNQTVDRLLELRGQAAIEWIARSLQIDFLLSE